jgi:uncharacterized protein with HEPN domain
MLDAAREAIAFGVGLERSDLEQRRMLVLAVLKDIEIVGEAATRVSEETRAQLAAIPWTEIVGMRNRLIHAYFDVDLDRVWDTLTVDLPALVGLLEGALPGH